MDVGFKPHVRYSTMDDRNDCRAVGAPSELLEKQNCQTHVACVFRPGLAQIFGNWVPMLH
jgi:hypothetical protein